MNDSQTLFDFDSKDILSGVRVYFCGKFSQKTSILADKMEARGAITRSITANKPTLLGLSKETCVIVKGKNVPEKDIAKILTLIHDGYHIPVISEADIDDILNGIKPSNFPAPIKSVDINFDSLFNSIVPKIIHFNFYGYTHPVGQKNIFLHNIRGDNFLLEQRLGNIGAYSCSSFDPYDVDYCWLKKDTIDLLRDGEKDDFIKIITDSYNSSSNTKFTYKFIIESEAIYWMVYRAKDIGDKVSLEYITRYLESIY